MFIEKFGVSAMRLMTLINCLNMLTHYVYKYHKWHIKVMHTVIILTFWTDSFLSNIADPDQTAPRGEQTAPGSSLFALSFSSFW